MVNNFLIDNFKHLTTTPENVEQLKKLVLQMAVQGNLTAKWREDVKTQNLASPDDPNYNAHALLQKIKTEKEQFIKEGKIKRQKPLSPIADEEKPFELPESWEWERLGDLRDFTFSISYGVLVPGKDVKDGVPFVRVQDLDNYKYNKGPNKKISKEIEIKYKKTRLVGNEILICVVGSIGKLAFTASNWIGANIARAVCRFMPNVNISKEYLFLYLQSNPMQTFFKKETRSINPTLNVNILEKSIIALPPLAEQQAIVSQVEELFTQIDQLHALAQKRLNYREKSAKALFSKINHAENDTELQETWQTLTAHFHTLTQSNESVKQLRQSILQMAVQGKLTAKWREENPDVEPASVLFEKIKAEKEQLIKDKIVKKGKKQPPATIDILDIPKSWLLVDLDDISQFITDGTHQTPRYVDKGKIFLSAQNIKPFKFMPEQHKYVSEAAYLEYIKNKKAEKGDILVGRVGSKGEAAVVDRELEFAIYVSLGLVKTFQNYTSPDYLVDVMNSPYGNSYATGNMSSLGASAGNFNLGRIRSFPIPFPSLEEQKTIVFKVKQLMAWCDELEKKIEKRDAYQEKMMQAVAKNVLTAD